MLIRDGSFLPSVELWTIPSQGHVHLNYFQVQWPGESKMVVVGRKHPQTDLGSIIFGESGFCLNLQTPEFRFHVTLIQGTKSPSFSGWPRQGDTKAHLDSASFWGINKNVSHLCGMLAGNQQVQFPLQTVDGQKEHTAASWGLMSQNQLPPLKDAKHRTSQPSLLEMYLSLAPSSKDPISGSLPK